MFTSVNSSCVTRAGNFIVVIVLIAVYLARPTPLFAHAAIMDSGSTAAQTAYREAASAPGESCPSSDERGSDCCDASCCNCMCHAPLTQSFRLIYAPVVDAFRYVEQFRTLPQVYRPIFVPPQNPAPVSPNQIADKLI